MSKILKVTPNDDYTLLAEFEHGNKIIFNMKELIRILPFSKSGRFKPLQRHHGGRKSHMPARAGAGRKKHHAPATVMIVLI